MSQLPINLVELLYDGSLPRSDRRAAIESVEQVLDSPSAEEIISGFTKEEKIRLYTNLAAHYLQSSLSLKGVDKEEQLKKFRNMLNRSDKLEINERRSFILKGYYFYFLNDFKQAMDYFDNAGESDATNLSCLVGKGLIEYHRKNYKDSLVYLKNCFKFFRRLFPQSAYLLGLIYFKLDKAEQAEKCFQYYLKTVQSEAERVIALSALAVVYLKLKKYSQHYSAIVNAFQNKIHLCDDESNGGLGNDAYKRASSSEANGSHPSSDGHPDTNQAHGGSSTRCHIRDPNVTLYLAEHYFYKGEFAKAEKLAAHTLQIISSWPFEKPVKVVQLKLDFLEIRSRAIYIQAYIHHAAGTPESLNEAYKLYSAAIESHPMNFTAQFGLGQIYLSQKNYNESLNCLEFINKHTNDNDSRDCYRMIPYLHMRVGNRTAAVQSFDKAIHYYPGNLEVLLEYAGFVEFFDVKLALKLYQDIQGLLEKQENHHHRSPEVYNNIAAMHFKECSFANAAKLLAIATDLARQALLHHESTVQNKTPFKEHSSINPKEIDQSNLENLQRFAQSNEGPIQGSEAEVIHRLESTLATITFNNCLVSERLGRISEAIAGYEEQVKINPLFYEVYLRLAQLYHRLGETEKSIEAIEKAIAVCCKYPKLARVEAAICTRAQILIDEKNYQQALQFLLRTKINDPFISLLRANAIYHHIPFSRENPLELKKLVREAAEECRRVFSVKEEEGNLFAANLVSCLLAERGRLDEGIQVLNSFQDLIKEHKGALYNLALMRYSSGSFVKALSCFDVDKSNMKNRYKTLFIFTLIELGDMQQAEKLLKYKMLKNPSLKGFYNLAMMLHLKIKTFVKNKLEKFEDVEQLVANTQHAEKIFRQVFESIPGKVFVCLESYLNSNEIKRRELVSLKKKCEHQLFILQQNDKNYRSILDQEKQRKDLQKISKEQRRHILDIQKEKGDLKNEELKRQKELEEEELERRAQEATLKAQNISLQLGKPKIDKDVEKREKKATEKKEDKPKASRAKKQKGTDSDARTKTKGQKDRSNKNKTQRRKRDDEFESEESEEPIISQGEFSETEREDLGSASDDYENSEEELVKRAESKVTKPGVNKKLTETQPPVDSRRIKTETSKLLPDIVLKKPDSKAKERKKSESSISSFIDDNSEEDKFDEEDEADSQSEAMSEDVVPERKSNIKTVVPENAQRKKKVFMVDEDEDE